MEFLEGVMKLEKYGFIYIWFDRYRKMYYIGCHWGHENDGYICSSNRMRDAYRRRPRDFKRRILSRIFSKRELLSEQERSWLSLIADSELGTKYYNLNKGNTGHWTNYPDKVLKISEKLSISIKKKIEEDKQYRASLGKKGMNWYNNGEIDKRFYDDKVPNGFTRGRLHTHVAWNKGISPSDEQKFKQSEELKRRYACEEIVPHNKGNGIVKICEHCHKEYKRPPSRSNSKYCSTRCKSEANSREITCIRCGKTRRVGLSILKNERYGKYCSGSCRTKDLMLSGQAKMMSDKRWEKNET